MINKTVPFNTIEIRNYMPKIEKLSWIEIQILRRIYKCMTNEKDIEKNLHHKGPFLCLYIAGFSNKFVNFILTFFLSELSYKVQNSLRLDKNKSCKTLEIFLVHSGVPETFLYLKTLREQVELRVIWIEEMLKEQGVYL